MQAVTDGQCTRSLVADLLKVSVLGHTASGADSLPSHRPNFKQVKIYSVIMTDSKVVVEGLGFYLLLLKGPVF